MKKNEDIRALLKKIGVKQWEIAKATGINEATLSRKLTREYNGPRVKTSR